MARSPSLLRYPSIAADLRRLDEVLTIGSPRAAAMRFAAAQWAKGRADRAVAARGPHQRVSSSAIDALLAATEATL